MARALTCASSKRQPEFLASEVSVPVLDGDVGQAAPSIRLRDGRVVWARTDRRFSTTELLAVEGDVIQTAVAGVGAQVAVASDHALADALALRPYLAEEQVTMVRRLVTEGDRVAIVVGPAGGATTQTETKRSSGSWTRRRCFGRRNASR